MHAGVTFALVAALLFGASTPLAKSLVGGIPPVMLAGLLYAGSGVGLLLVLVVRRLIAGPRFAIARPSWRDAGWLSGAILFGGVLGPVLLMSGLATTLASTASLLLNLESVFTALLAWFVFRENFDGRIAAGMLAIAAGGVVLAWEPAAGRQVSIGSLLVAAACLCWAVDNNLTRKVAGSDAMVIAGVKGMVAGASNLAIALLVLRQPLPTIDLVAAAGVVGFFGYGLSLCLFVLALRHLGTARTGAYFAVAPFFGVVLALALQQEAVTVQLLVAGVLMAGGVWLHVTERHLHTHRHLSLPHEHAHTHDSHHAHEHEFAWDGREPHSHPHVHAPLVHAHAHYPDLHHRHEH